ncbi:glycosyltransferase family A protein [Ornithobacterium rhinotracheale]|uniref:glycosyltransferase family A protein n=1 Tax=Ornithobacterium rhinotracheale TaxID=28251 RepID=UPI001FF6729B|nr:glycosyltransferase family A protein [Ornithobacterium rhinotracheale]MCK0205496.1 glycosyltransferase family 2 protein [Ornithobacterium rhinotracheale]
MKDVLIKFLKKSHLNKLVYKIYKQRLKSFSKKYDDNDVRSARELLSRYNVDCKSSSLTKNNIEIEYDLQIIIPVYNVEKYIEECIESVVNQKTKYSYIVTVINDGSPDNSRELLKKYESIRNIEIIDQENKGFSGARNTGLSLIKGKYVTFLDSDDVLHDDAIQSLLYSAF